MFLIQEKTRFPKGKDAGEVTRAREAVEVTKPEGV